MYGLITTVSAPVEMYDRMHAEMRKRTGTSIDGLLVHVGRAAPDGFQVLEVWESKDHYDRANTNYRPSPDARDGRRTAATLGRARDRGLRRTRPGHPCRQHPDLTAVSPGRVHRPQGLDDAHGLDARSSVTVPKGRVGGAIP